MSSPGSSRPTSPSPSDFAQTPVRAAAPSYRFAFDRQRGPASVFSDANESKLEFSAAELATASQDVYASLELPDSGNYTFAPSWSSSRHGFNAISTVLNNPKRVQAPLKSSRAPLPPVVSPDLPRVRRKDFDAYVNAITPAWEQFTRHAPQRTPNDFSLHSSIKGKTREIPPLSTVPAIFFDPLFDLRNPRTFASVTEQDSVNNGASSSQKTLNPEDISLNQVLQEKLSHYMDVVEQHLTREVQSRSTSFFAALSNLQDLQTEGADCLDRIGSLRKRLEEVDTNIARKGLQTVKLQKRLSNLRTVEHATAALKEISDMLSLCDRLIAEANWDEALALVVMLEDVASPKAAVTGNGATDHTTHMQQNGQPQSHLNGGVHNLPTPNLSSPLILDAPASPGRTTSQLPPSDSSQLHHTSYSLSSLSALTTLPAHIRDYRSRISSSLRTSAIDLLRSDLVERFESGSSSPEALASQNEKLRQRFVPLWHGLLRTGGVSDALVSYHDVVLSSVRSCVRKNLPQKADVDEDADLDSAKSPSMGERTAVLQQELRKLSHDDYLALSRSLYGGILGLLEGVVEHSKLFNDPELLETKVPDAVRSANQQALAAVLPDVLPAAAELANTRLSKVVTVRADQHASLPLKDFLVIFNEGWSFIIKCEVMARKMIVGLRGVMVSQAKSFLLAFHNARLSSSANLVENEQWAQVEVPAAAQRWSDLLVQGAVSDPPEFVLYTPPQQGDTPQPNAKANGATSPSAGHAATGKSLLIDGHPYFVVSATLKVIEMLLDYMRVIVNLSLLTTEAMSRTIEYLKAFNSRTCQVVLGAGAMRSAGLKNITAKHLALASQSLSAMIALIPYVRETFRRHLNPKQAVMLIEFDKLKRDYHEHQNEIHSKLIAIMGDRLAFHCKTLHSINWEETAQPAESPNMYMRVLMKETLTLHKVLSKYLATQAVEFIMSQVFAAINHRLSEEYAKIDLPSQEAKDRLLQDARYLHHELSNLKDINMSNTMLETVVKEKSVRRKSPFANTVRRTSALMMASSVSESSLLSASSAATSSTSMDRIASTTAMGRSSLGPGDSTTSLVSSVSTPQVAVADITSTGPSVPDKKSANGGFREVIDVPIPTPITETETEGTTAEVGDDDVTRPSTSTEGGPPPAPPAKDHNDTGSGSEVRPSPGSGPESQTET